MFCRASQDDNVRRERLERDRVRHEAQRYVMSDSDSHGMCSGVDVLRLVRLELEKLTRNTMLGLVLNGRRCMICYILVCTVPLSRNFDRVS